MFPLERNGVKPLKEGFYESWHQVATVPSTPAANPGNRFNWGDIGALIGEQTQLVTFNPRIEGLPAATSTSKGKKCRVFGKTKPLKRLGKPRTGVKRMFQTSQWIAITSQRKRMSLRLRKRGIPLTGMLQKVQKKVKKSNQKLRQKMQIRRNLRT